MFVSLCFWLFFVGVGRPVNAFQYDTTYHHMTFSTSISIRTSRGAPRRKVSGIYDAILRLAPRRPPLSVTVFLCYQRVIIEQRFNGKDLIRCGCRHHGGGPSEWGDMIWAA
jgi:hypothetical protein